MLRNNKDNFTILYDNCTYDKSSVTEYKGRISKQWISRYIPDETRRQINQALINEVKRVTPIFEQQCKAELRCAKTSGKLMNNSLGAEVNK